jgi:teichoic acid transport system permease protein
MADPERHPAWGPEGAGGGSWADLARLCAAADEAFGSGSLDEAEGLYAVVRAREPGHPAAELGTAAVLRRRAAEQERRGRSDAASELSAEADRIERAAKAGAEVRPRTLLVRQARARADAGDMEAAVRLLQDSVRAAIGERRVSGLADELEDAGTDEAWRILVARAALTAQADAERAADLASLLRNGPRRPASEVDGALDPAADIDQPDPPAPLVVASKPPVVEPHGPSAGPAEAGMVFESHRGGLPPMAPYFAEVWRRRQFLVHMARAKLKGQHADTLAGRAWTLLNPILLALTYFMLVTVLLDAQSTTTVYLGTLLSGLFAFFYTSNAIRMGALSVVGAGNLVMNTAFPRLLLPLSACVSALLLFLPMLLVYAVFHLAVGLPLGPQLAAVPLIIALQTSLCAGLAMLVAVANVFVRDVGRALPYALRLWLYLSPVLWTIDQVPDSAARVVEFSPLYPILVSWHQVLIDGEGPGGWLLAQAGAWGAVTLVAGTVLFLRKEREFAVRI